MYSVPIAWQDDSSRHESSYDDSSRHMTTRVVLFVCPLRALPAPHSVLDFPTHLVQGPRGHHQAALYGLGCVTGDYCVSDRRCRDRDRRETTLDRRNQPILRIIYTKFSEYDSNYTKKR